MGKFWKASWDVVVIPVTFVVGFAAQGMAQVSKGTAHWAWWALVGLAGLAAVAAPLVKRRQTERAEGRVVDALAELKLAMTDALDPISEQLGRVAVAKQQTTAGQTRPRTSRAHVRWRQRTIAAARVPAA